MKHTLTLDTPILSLEENSLSRALLEMLAVAGAVALAALIRFGEPVPVTLQTLPVLLVGFAVGPKRATGGLALYLAMGLCGVPVFASSVALGKTFGFLVAFLAVPTITSRFSKSPALGLAVASAVIYALGSLWFSMFTGMPWATTLTYTVLPFIGWDVVKAAVAYKLIPLVRR
jgi:biotin transport system substrate-specific component